MKRRRLAFFATPLFLVPALTLASSCASVDFDRRTATSGTFTSSALTFTIFSFDFPDHALNVARENASDSLQPNITVREERIFPHLGPFDWILDILSLRYARVAGTWGYPPTETTDASATPGSSR